MTNADLQQIFDEMPEQKSLLYTRLSERLLSIAQQERHRLAELLHDDALQLGCQAERLLRDTLEGVPALHPSAAERVNEALALTRALLARLRGTVQEYYATPLELVGLPAALRVLLQGVEQRTGLTYLLNCASFLEYPLAHTQEVALYAIAREAILNAVRHARATHLDVTLQGNGETLLLRVRDNGQGFVLQSADALLATGHMGLMLLQMRAHSLHASIHIQTAPGEGTTLEVRKSLAHEDAA